MNTHRFTESILIAPPFGLDTFDPFFEADRAAQAGRSPSKVLPSPPSAVTPDIHEEEVNG